MFKLVFRYYVVVLMVMMFGLSGCSAVKLAYRQGPELSHWWIDSYLDLNEQQSDYVTTELAQLFSWHRAHELDKTADFLAHTAQWATGEISAAQACQMYGEAKNLIENVAQQALPKLAQLAGTLSPAQLLYMKARLAKKRAEFERDFLQGSIGHRQEIRLQRMQERYEKIYGTLNEPLLSLLRQQVAQSGFDAVRSGKELERRHTDLLVLFARFSTTAPPAFERQQALGQYFRDLWESPDAQYREYAKRMVSQNCENFATLHNRTSPQQRENAQRVIRGYEADLRDLTRP